MINVHIEFWSGGGQGGARIVWFNNDTEMLTYWYADSMAKAKQYLADHPEPPDAAEWVPWREPNVPDAATQTGMYDHW